jgi:tetratricopeptide (TPR) repeat protein
MAVFAGGCTLEAAEAVCNYDNKGIDVLEGISSLLDKSLLRQADTGGEPRFFMLETLREYGLEQMEQVGEIEEVRRAHVEFYLPSSADWLIWADNGTPVPEVQPFGETSASEMGNLRAASNWLIEHNTEEALLICTALSFFWHNHRYHSDARYLIEKTLALPGASSKPGYPQALFVAGTLAQVHGDMAVAAARFESTVALLRERRLGTPGTPAAPIAPGDRRAWFLGWALGNVAMSVAGKEGPAASLDIFAEGVEELRASGNEVALGLSEVGLGAAYTFRAELDKAHSTLEEAVAIGRRHTHLYLTTAATQLFGDVKRVQGDFKGAAALYQESLSLARDLGIEAEIRSMLHNLAYTELGQGNTDRARELFMKSVTEQRDTEHKGAIAETLAGFGALAASGGQAERAMRLYGAAMAVWESNSLVVWPAEKAEYDRYLPRARAQVDEATWKKAWDEGYAMGMHSLEQSLDYALQGAQQAQKQPGEIGDTPRK